MSKVKDRERILNLAREEQFVTYKGTPTRLLEDFSTQSLRARRAWHDIFKIMKGKKPTTENTLSSKVIFQILRSYQELYRQVKEKGLSNIK